MTLRASLVLAVVAALLTGSSGFLHWREAEARARHARSMNLFQLAQGEIDGFEIYEGSSVKAKAIFRREADGIWKVALPDRRVSDFADARTVEELLAVVQRASLRPAENLTPAGAGLDDPEKTVLLVIRSGERVQETLVLGGLSDSGRARYVTRGDAPEEVHMMHADLLRVLERPSTSYRSLDLFDLYRDGPARITLLPAGGADAAAAVVFSREPEGWFLTTPVRWPADDERLDELIRFSRMLRAREVVTDRVDTPAAFGLGDDAPAMRLLVDDQEQEVRFGNDLADGEGLYAMRVGREPVYAVVTPLAGLLERGRPSPERQDWVNRFRRRDLRLLPDQRPATVFLQQPGGASLVLSRGRDGKTWSASGTRQFDVEARSVELLLDTLQELQARDFVRERQENLPPLGLDKPKLRIVCTDPAGGQILGLSLGRGDEQHQGRIFAAVDGMAQVVELPVKQGEMLLRREISYRTRQLTQIAPENVFEVRVVSSAWERTYQALPTNQFVMIRPTTRDLRESQLAFQGLVSRLCRLRCLDYLGENVADLSQFELDQPRLRVIVTLRSEQDRKLRGRVGLDLAIGSALPGVKTEDGKPPVFGALTGEQTVFLLDGFLAGELEREW